MGVFQTLLGLKKAWMKNKWLPLLYLLYFFNVAFSNNLNIPGITLHLDASNGVVVNANNELISWTPLVGDAIFKPLNAPPLLQKPTVINGYSAVRFSFDGNEITTDSIISIGSVVAFTHFINPNNDNIFPGSSGLISSKNIDLFFMGQVGTNNMFYDNQFSQYSKYIINKKETTQWGDMSDWKVIIGRGNQETISNLLIGKDRGVNTREWNGYVTEVITFDHFLTEEEVSQINEYFYSKYQSTLDLVDEIVKNDFCKDTIHLKDQFQSVSWLNFDGDTLSHDSLFVVDESVSLVVVAKDVFGVVHRDTIHVVYPEIIPPVTNTFCKDESFVWDTKLGEDFNYKWVKNNSDTISQLEVLDLELKNLDSIYVVVEDNVNGCAFVSNTEVVKLDDLSENEFTLDFDTVCRGQDVSVIPQREGLNYYWEDIKQTDSYTIWQTDSVSVVISNASGCNQKIKKYVVVNGVSPVASFTFDYLCTPQRIKLYDQSYYVNELGDSTDASNLVSKKWVIDDEIIVIHDSSVVDVLSEGEHLFKYIVEGAESCRDSLIRVVQIDSIRNPMIIYEGVCVGDTIELSDAQDYTPFVVSERIWNVNTVVYENDSLVKIAETGVSSYEYIYSVIFENGCSRSEEGVLALKPKVLCDGVSGMKGVSLHLEASQGVVLAEGNKVASWTSMASPITFEPLSLAPNITSPFEINGTKAVEFTFEGNGLTTNSPISIGSVVAVTKFNNPSQTNEFPGSNGLVSSKNIDLFFLGQEGGNALFFNNQFSKYSVYNINREQKAFWGEMDEWKIIIGSGEAEVINGLILGQDRTVQNREWNGYLAELITFDHKLSEGEMDTIYQYLEAKYHQSHTPIADITNSTLCPTRVELPNNFNRYKWIYENQIISTDSILETRLSGEFVLQVTNAFGVAYLDTFMISQPIIQSEFDNTVCFDSSFVWEISTGHSFNANWFKNDLSFSSFETLIDTSPAHGDLYFGVLTDSIGCEFATDTIQVEIDDFALLSLLSNDTIMCSGQTLSPNTDSSYVLRWEDDDTSFYHEVNLDGDYILNAINSNKCSNTDTIEVFIKGEKPELDLELNEVLCDEDVLKAGFLAGNYGAISQIDWFVNDTLRSNDSIIDYDLSIGGYDLSLSVIDSIGCETLIDTSFVIYAKPEADFEHGLSCSKDSTAFFDRSSVLNDNIISWQWISNTDTFSLANPNIYFNDGGINPITLIVSSDQNCFDTLQQNIEINSSALAKIDAQIKCINNESMLQSTSIDFGNAIIEYSWTVDDKVLLGEQINYTFNTIGEHTAKLEVTNTKGCVSDTTIALNITSVPSISVEHYGLCANSSASLFVKSNTKEDTIATTQWYLGDLGVYSTDSISIVLNDKAPYGFVDIITARGCTISQLLDLELIEAPSASFSASETYGAPPLQVEFINTSSNYSFIEWQITEDSLLYNDTISHVYTAEGIYDLNLMARNEEGCLSEKMIPIEVFEPDFNIDFKSLFVDDAGYVHVVLENTEKITISNLVFDFDFGSQNTLTFKTDTSISGGELYELISDFEVDKLNLSSLKYICVGVSFDESTEKFKSCITYSDDVMIDVLAANPSQHDILINLYSPISQKVEVSLYDVGGSLIQNSIVNLKKGGNEILVERNDIKSGMYILKFEFSNSSIIQKIIFE